MQALILSGGFGKRLKPITDYVPKPLIPIDNIPIIEWQIRYLMKFGITDFIICGGYKNDQIVNFMNTKDFDVKIHYSIEKSALGTGGAIKLASRFIMDENFFVINGDVLTNLDLKKMQSHKNSIALVQLKSNFGVVEIDNDMITNFLEKPTLSDYWMNAGVYFLSKQMIKYLPTKGNIETTAFPVLSGNGELAAVKYSKVFWCSIDSHKDIEECTKQMRAINYRNFIFRGN